MKFMPAHCVQNAHSSEMRAMHLARRPTRSPETAFNGLASAVTTFWYVCVSVFGYDHVAASK